jgi:hypothetical protein
MRKTTRSISMPPTPPTLPMPPTPPTPPASRVPSSALAYPPDPDLPNSRCQALKSLLALSAPLKTPALTAPSKMSTTHSQLRMSTLR